MRKPKHHRGINKVTYLTSGKKVPGLKFQGEVMVCAMCGKQQESDPAVESGWRYIQVGERGGYVCTDHFPANPETASKEEWSKFYQAAILAVMGK